jgi:hypothetical protein
MAKSEECLIGGTDALSSGKAHSILFQQEGAPIFGGGRIPASQKRQVNKHKDPRFSSSSRGCEPSI